MNYFNSKIAAEKYAAGRPDFHAGTIQRVRDFLNIEGKLPKALDIACGTGLSARALLSIAVDVYGIDSSEEMLKLAVEPSQIHYSVAAAEKQPFGDGEFDLITACSAVHWFDIEAFLNETNRLLKKGRWLVIYENFFAGEMDGHDDFNYWVNNVYLARFPSPPRNKNYDWSVQNLQSKNFTIQTPDGFKNPICFTKSQLIAYFITQSNVIAAVERGSCAYEEIALWLDGQLDSYFENDLITRVVYYGNWIKYLRKT